MKQQMTFPKPVGFDEAIRHLPLPDHRGLTLEAAQDIVNANIEKGGDCPCCGQFTKRYKYKFSENICKFLLALYKIRLKSERFVHVKEILNVDSSILMSRDFLRPHYFGLIEEGKNEDTDKKKRSGLWRLTDKGVQFCQRSIGVPKYVVIYNNTILGFEGDQVYIDDFWGDYFSYREAMSV